MEAYVEQLAKKAAEMESLEANVAEERQDAVDGLLAFRRSHRLTLDRDPAVGLRSWMHEEHRY